MYVVSIMPCTAKKTECSRPELMNDGVPNVDAVLTTRELGDMIKTMGIDFLSLPDEEFDAPLGLSTGAADIFGVTGGVMEAALRTVAEIVTGKPLESVDFHDVRGIEGIKEATVNIGGTDVNVAVANGTGNATKLLERVKSGEKKYTFLEVMACPGGCVNGGGQPIVSAETKMDVDVRVERAKALYGEDVAKPLRKSHENAEIKQIYADFLDKPGSHLAHELLHTTYQKREKYSK
jgi:NADP-reducing hydrogenase subunit HndD